MSAAAQHTSMPQGGCLVHRLDAGVSVLVCVAYAFSAAFSYDNVV